MAGPEILFAAAAVGGAAGQLQQGAAAQNAAEHNARVNELNARLARQQGDEQARSIRRQGRQHLGRIRAQTGASGIQVSGSALDVMARDAFDIEMDAQTTRYNAAKQAAGLELQTRQARAQGRQQRTAARIGAGTQLLQGVTNVVGAD